MPEQLYTVRLRCTQAGGHTHLSVWTGKTGYTLGKAGELCMTNEEFAALRDNTALIEFICEPDA